MLLIRRGRRHWDCVLPFLDFLPGISAFRTLKPSLLCSRHHPDPVWSPQTDAELQRRTLAELERYNIIAVTSGSAGKVAQWQRMAPRRILPAIEFQLGPNAPSIEALRELHALGRLVVIGEVTNQYAGIAPDDPKMEPYYQLAEELDLPIGLHIGTGPPGTP